MSIGSELKCRVCGAPIDKSGIDEDRKLATCSHCSTVRDLSRPGSRERPEVPIPERFELEQSAGSLTVSRRWFQPAVLFLAFFTLAWNSFLVPFVAGSLFSLLQGEWQALFGLLFTAPHLAVGILLIWFTAAGFLNRTRVSYSQGRLTIRHSPVPWRGNLDIETRELVQLYCQRKVSGGRGSKVTFELHAVLASGKQRKLISGLDDVTQSLWLEQQIEHSLSIEDQPVGGEWCPTVPSPDSA